jgi:hypothetical protein
MIGNPHEHAGVPRGFEVAPFDHQLNIRKRLPRAQNPDRLTGAGQHIALPRPRILIAVHARKIGFAERPPAGAVSIDERTRHRRSRLSWITMQRRAHQCRDWHADQNHSLARCHHDVLRSSPNGTVSSQVTALPRS